MADITELLDEHAALTHDVATEAVGGRRAMLFVEAKMLRDAASEIRRLRTALLKIAMTSEPKIDPATAAREALAPER